MSIICSVSQTRYVEDCTYRANIRIFDQIYATKIWESSLVFIVIYLIIDVIVRDMRFYFYFSQISNVQLPLHLCAVCVWRPQPDLHHRQGIKMSNTAKVTSQTLSGSIAYNSCVWFYAENTNRAWIYRECVGITILLWAYFCLTGWLLKIIVSIQCAFLYTAGWKVCFHWLINQSPDQQSGLMIITVQIC